MLQSYLDIYAVIFTLAGLVTALIPHLEILLGTRESGNEHSSSGKLPRDKRNAFSWIGFFSLTLVGLLTQIFAFIFNITPNSPNVEIPFCFFYAIGPFIIYRKLVVDKETGKLMVSTSLRWIYVIGCWIWPFKAVKQDAGGALGIIVIPIFGFLLLGVSWILVLGVFISLIIFSGVFSNIRILSFR